MKPKLCGENKFKGGKRVFVWAAFLIDVTIDWK
jgi:hypothetical protein